MKLVHQAKKEKTLKLFNNCKIRIRSFYCYINYHQCTERQHDGMIGIIPKIFKKIVLWLPW